MNQNLELDAEQIAFHIKAAEIRIAALNDRIAGLLKEITIEQQLIIALRSNKSDTGYNPNDTWFAKAKFILNKKRTLLTSNEMIGLIGEEYEPDILSNTEELAKIKSNLAGQLKMGLDKTFKRLKISGEPNFYYGLISWFKGDDCKSEYLPRPTIENDDDSLESLI